MVIGTCFSYLDCMSYVVLMLMNIFCQKARSNLHTRLRLKASTRVAIQLIYKAAKMKMINSGQVTQTNKTISKYV